MNKKNVIIIVTVLLVICIIISGIIIWNKSTKPNNGDSGIIKYDNGDYYYIPKEENIAFDEESNLLYYNNLINVFLWNDIDKAAEKRLADSVNGTIVGRTYGSSNTLQIRIEESNLGSIEEYIARLSEDENVLYADYEMPNYIDISAEDKNPWNDGSTTEKNDWWAQAIGAYKAWNNADKIKEPVVVGVVDNGVDNEHDDFKSNGKSKVTVIDSSAATPNDHATHVAGIIGAINNSEGLRGIADKSNILSVDAILSKDFIGAQKQLYDRGVKVINNSWGLTLYSEHGFTNEEIVSPTNPQGKQYDFLEKELLTFYAKYFTNAPDAYDKYLKYFTTLCKRKAMESICLLVQFELQGNHDFIIVQSAGNGYEDSTILGNSVGKGVDAFFNGSFAAVCNDTYNLFSESIRAKMEEKGITYEKLKEHIIIVGAVQQNKKDNKWQLCDFSNFGNTVDIVAPGENIFSCATTRDDSDEKNSARDGNSYDTMDGTSMAAPMVSGSAAFLWSMKPELTSADIKALLLCNGEKAEGVTETDKGKEYTMLNLGKAIDKLLADEKYPIYKAYFEYLRDHSYWFNSLGYSYTNSVADNQIALFDIDGNNVPELVFLRPADDTNDLVISLCILTFKDGAVVELYDDRLISLPGAESIYEILLSTDAKLYSIATNYPNGFLSRYDISGNSVKSVLLAEAQGEGTDILETDINYYIVGEKTTKEEYQSYFREIKNSAETVLIAYHGLETDDISMSYDEACDFFKHYLMTNGKGRGTTITFNITEADVEVGSAIDVYCTSGQDLQYGELKTSAGDYSKCFKTYILGYGFSFIANREGSETFTFTSLDGAVGTFTINAVPSTKNTEWKDLYIDFLSTIDLNAYSRGDVILLNDDDIPEIVLKPVSAMPGAIICWISDGKVQVYDGIGYSQAVMYKSKSGIICVSSYRQGHFSGGVLSFDGKTIEVLMTGEEAQEYISEHDFDGSLGSSSELIYKIKECY